MPSMIAVACPECHKEMKAPATLLGKSIRCKHCGHTFALGGGAPAAKGKGAPPPKGKGAKPSPAKAKSDDEEEELDELPRTLKVGVVAESMAPGELTAVFDQFKLSRPAK